MNKNPFDISNDDITAPDSLKKAVMESVSMSSFFIEIADLFTHKSIISFKDMIIGESSKDSE